MNLSDRIQALRKSKGISQEELADRLGVSRQAVSKWESEQSMPDLDRVIQMSELFDVTTDYILKGIEPAPSKAQADARLGSRVLYIGSTVMIFIGQLAAMACWYESQSLSDVFGPMSAQVLGIAGYFIGRALSDRQASFWTKLLNVLGLAFMPCSMLASVLSYPPFGGLLSPYPMNLRQMAVFLALYGTFSAGTVLLLRRRKG